MKKILFLTISLLLAGCGASRQVMKTAETGVCDMTSTEMAETTTDRTKLEQTSAEQERNEEVIIVTTEYDTSQPADPATGTPPVKVRTMQVRRTATKARQEEKTESAETETQVSSQETVGHSESEAIVETTSRRGMSGVQRILCTIGLLAIIGIAGWLLWRWFRR
ncbi:hypothetical protein [uncultured Alistipes sp.]|uniref:hypothetical protein n=1 Tax=uncultured Alistipes sp. TaxID=538949 RepID=UPI00272A888D|nr:hypothetical protein [uncultured Alistipes sp.]